MRLVVALLLLSFGSNGQVSGVRSWTYNSDSVDLNTSTRRLGDSLKILAWGDSMRASIDRKFPDDLIRHRLDSVRKLKIPKLAKQHKLDSIGGHASKLHQELTSKQAQLQSNLSKRYDAWSKSLSGKLNSDSSGIKLPGLNVPTLPSAQLPTQAIKAPTLSVVANLPQTNLPEIPSLNTLDFADLEMSEDLAKVNSAMAVPSMDKLNIMEEKITEFTGPLNEYKEKLAIAKGSMKDPSNLVDEGVNNLGEVQKVTGQLDAAKAAQTNNEFTQTADQLKDTDVEAMIQNQSIDHFAGKEVAVKAAMEQLAKYKEKYPSINSLSEIKKETWLPKNGLKGVPFRSRIRYGLNIGFQNNRDTLLVDFYPNASYRISGRLEMGAGFMYRVKGVKNDVSVDQYRPAWGTTIFGVVKTFKTIYIRFESDATSYPAQAKADGASYRDWRWTFMSGIQTNFKLSRQLSGNIQMLYNFDKSLKDVFPDRLSLRFGVQYKLKAKPAQESK